MHVAELGQSVQDTIPDMHVAELGWSVQDTIPDMHVAELGWSVQDICTRWLTGISGDACIDRAFLFNGGPKHVHKSNLLYIVDQTLFCGF